MPAPTPALALPPEPETECPTSPLPTLREIARASGVSHVTVSRVLRNAGKVGPEVREKVRQVARKLGYRPNPMVGSLMAQVQARNKKTYQATLAWINPHIQRGEWRQRAYRKHFYEGALDRARELGFRVDEFWTEEKGMTPQRFQQILTSRGIHGAIIAQALNPRFFPKMDWSEFAVVTIGQPPFDVGWHCVDSDCARNLEMAVRHALSLGYKRIGMVLGPAHDGPTHPWRATFLAMQTDWRAVDRVPMLRLKKPFEEDVPTVIRWVKDRRPDVIICCDSRLVNELEKAGLRVPADVGVIHLHLAEDVEDWAGIEPRDNEVGSAAVSLVSACLLRNERGLVPIPRRSLVPGVWRMGRTVRPA